MTRPLRFSLAFALALGAALPAQAQDDAEEDFGREIVVQGQRTTERAVVTEMAREVTRRPRIDKPISRRYDDVCLGIFGLKAGAALTLIGRVEDNLSQLGIGTAGEGCRVNSLIAFVDDAPGTVKTLQKEEPQLFEGLLDYEIDRIFAGSTGAQAWQTTRNKGANGREFQTIEIGNPPREVQANQQTLTGRTTQQIRTDIVGAIVLFDVDRVSDKTLQQLADYATMRLIAPTADFSADEGAIDSILTLFVKDALPPEGLTTFDRAYLEALYKLPPTAKGSQIRDATWSAYRSLQRQEETAN
ncbi:hypothetical protein SAMN06297468_0255 [Altererythrobacter xiamenensis]|uniref:Uncharacterized protein n=1 Tax=Altererythrobacter xiamenensis TaxID=1316679 RepID=A0A1Y6E9G7_9SPHN|nr:hypothetical protein [Altererythrobacter xiamenensis]SMQ59238.1 hypothetical protein SAMN06297468_0255 [Altererythrobacter xiamenensis]